MLFRSNSRIDFLVKDIKGIRALVKVKGVTLEKTGRSYFPDAPTERGIKHLLELEKALNEGYGAYVQRIAAAAPSAARAAAAAHAPSTARPPR